MPEATALRRDPWGNLIINERHSLKDHIATVEREFPGVSFEELYFRHPSGFDTTDYEPDDFLLGRDSPHELQDIGENGFQTTMHGVITLAQVIRQVNMAPNCDYSKVRLFWVKWDFCIHIDK